MSERNSNRPAIVVSTIVERNGRYLLVEEETRAGLRLNQPAGHLEAGESLADAAVREALEETGWEVTPTALIAAYRWATPGNGTYVRFSFAGDAGVHHPSRALDKGIVQVLWLTYEELVSRGADHRSPLVLRSIDDYRAGQRWPLDFVQEVAS